MRRIYGFEHGFREVGKTRRIVHSYEEFAEYVNNSNSINSMTSVSAYQFMWMKDGKALYETAVIDKLVHDFDPGKGYDPLEESKKLDAFYEEHDIERIRVLSGGGIHLLPLTSKRSLFLNSPTAATRNAVRSMCAQAGVHFDEAVGVHPNQHIRVMNTWNGGKRRFCIPLTDSQYNSLTLKELYELAKKQQPLSDDMFVGSKRIDLRRFDVSRVSNNQTFEYSDDDVPVARRDMDRLCIYVNPDAGNRERFIPISHLVERGYSVTSIKVFMKGILNEDTFKHMLKEKQAETAVKRGYVGLNCSRIVQEGYCRHTAENPCPYEQKDIEV